MAVVISDDETIIERIASRNYTKTVVEPNFTKWRVEPFVSSKLVIVFGLEKAKSEIKKTIKLGKNNVSNHTVTVHPSFEEGLGNDFFFELFHWLDEEENNEIYNYNYTIVDTKEKLKELMLRAKASTVMAVDIETSGLYDKLFSGQGIITTAQFAFDDKVGYTLPVDHFENPLDKDLCKNAMKILIDGFNTENKTIICQGGYFEKMWFLNLLGIDLIETEDTLFIEHLITHMDGSRLDLATLAAKYLNVGYKDMVKIWMTKNNCKDWAKVPLSILGQYGAYDAVITFKLWHLQREILEKDEELVEVYNNLVKPVVDTLVKMTSHGMGGDLDQLLWLKDYYYNEQQKYLEISKRIVERKLLALHDAGEIRKKPVLVEMLKKYSFFKEVADKALEEPELTDELLKEVILDYSRKFNPNSTIQVSTIVYEALEMPKLKGLISKGKTGAPGTGEEVMLKLCSLDVFLLNLAIYKKVTKMLTTYCIKMEGHLHQDNVVGNGHSYLFHPEFKAAGTRTGRLSCVNPPAQTIPFHTRIKRLFIPKNVARQKAELFSAIENQITKNWWYTLTLDLTAFEHKNEPHPEKALKKFGKQIAKRYNLLETHEPKQAVFSWTFKKSEEAKTLEEDLRKYCDKFCNSYSLSLEDHLD